MKFINTKIIAGVTAVILIGSMGFSSLTFASEGMKKDNNSAMMTGVVESRETLETQIDTLKMQNNVNFENLASLELQHQAAKEINDLTTMATLELSIEQLKAVIKLNNEAIHIAMKSLKSAIHKEYSSEQSMKNMEIKKVFSKMNASIKVLDMESISSPGHKFNFTAPPIMKDNHLLVPVKAMAEAFGATVVWNPEVKTVTLTKGDKIITLHLNSNEVHVNGVKVDLDMPAMAMKGNMYIPLKFIAQEFGMIVDWHADIEFAMLTHSKSKDSSLTTDGTSTAETTHEH